MLTFIDFMIYDLLGYYSNTYFVHEKTGLIFEVKGLSIQTLTVVWLGINFLDQYYFA